MSDGNGRIPIIGGHRPAMKKDSDLITVRECRAIVADECAKVHEYYLNQIPPFVGRMIQDALMSYGLIKLSDEAQLAATPTDGPSAAATTDAPAGSVEAVTPPGGVPVDAPASPVESPPPEPAA